MKLFQSKFKLQLLLITLLSFKTVFIQSQQIINIEQSIEIQANHSRILNYITDLSKGISWRAEVDSMVLITSNKYGKGAIEYSSFGKNKTITPTFLTSKDEFSRTFETPDTAKYYLASIRKVTLLESGNTLFTYVLRFDNNMTKEISPLRIPKIITKMFYGRRMKKYNKVLKKQLEH